MNLCPVPTVINPSFISTMIQLNLVADILTKPLLDQAFKAYISIALSDLETPTSVVAPTSLTGNPTASIVVLDSSLGATTSSGTTTSSGSLNI